MDSFKLDAPIAEHYLLKSGSAIFNKDSSVIIAHGRCKNRRHKLLAELKMTLRHISATDLTVPVRTNSQSGDSLRNLDKPFFRSFFESQHGRIARNRINVHTFGTNLRNCL